MALQYKLYTSIPSLKILPFIFSERFLLYGIIPDERSISFSRGVFFLLKVLWSSKFCSLSVELEKIQDEVSSLSKKRKEKKKFKYRKKKISIRTAFLVTKKKIFPCSYPGSSEILLRHRPSEVSLKYKKMQVAAHWASLLSQSVALDLNT